MLVARLVCLDGVACPPPRLATCAPLRLTTAPSPSRNPCVLHCLLRRQQAAHRGYSVEDGECHRGRCERTRAHWPCGEFVPLTLSCASHRCGCIHAHPCAMQMAPTALVAVRVTAVATKTCDSRLWGRRTRPPPPAPTRRHSCAASPFQRPCAAPSTAGVALRAAPTAATRTERQLGKVGAPSWSAASRSVGSCIGVRVGAASWSAVPEAAWSPPKPKSRQGPVPAATQQALVPFGSPQPPRRPASAAAPTADPRLVTGQPTQGTHPPARSRWTPRL